MAVPATPEVTVPLPYRLLTVGLYPFKSNVPLTVTLPVPVVPLGRPQASLLPARKVLPEAIVTLTRPVTALLAVTPSLRS